MTNKFIGLLVIIILIIGGYFLFSDRAKKIEIIDEKLETMRRESGEPAVPEVVTTELDIPWELVFLPTGDMLVSERGGRLVLLGEERKLIEVERVLHQGEGGLLGITLDPNFSQNSFIYLYLTTETSGTVENRVERYKLDDAKLSLRKVIVRNIPGSRNHNGGRIAFGPDGMLYITTGDAGNGDSAQDIGSLAGKILRVTRDGGVPKGNPFGNAVYSYGHRNVQGLAWDEVGNLWTTEHGRSGVLSGFDELNKIVNGGNYGWPFIQEDESRSGMLNPEINSGPSETWAPSGMTYWNDHLFFTGLRGKSLYSVYVKGGLVRGLESHLVGDYGRLRTVVVGPDDNLYILTSNRDGRGDPTISDDRIIKLDPKSLVN